MVKGSSLVPPMRGRPSRVALPVAPARVQWPSWRMLLRMGPVMGASWSRGASPPYGTRRLGRRQGGQPHQQASPAPSAYGALGGGGGLGLN